MGTWRMRAPKVPQSTLGCWKASIFSWSKVTKGGPKFKSQAEVSSKFKSYGAVNFFGSLDTIKGFKAFATEFGLELEEVLLAGGTPTPGIKHVPAVDLNRFHFNSKLKTSHVVVVFFTSETPFAHVVVVYGVDRFNVCFMNPLDRKDHVCEKFNDFGSPAHQYLMLWKP